MLEILQFIMSGFWVWLGVMMLLGVIVSAVGSSFAALITTLINFRKS